MIDWPFVSIIISNYNYDDYVRNCIESCMIQDYKGKFEVIVVDDCSTDNSYFRIKQNFGSKVLLLKTKVNSGYSVAKNMGIAESSGEFITTIDADDMLTTDSLRSRVEVFLEKPEIQLVHAQAYVIKGGGNIEYWIRRHYKIGVSHKTDKIHAQSVMVRRGVYTTYGMYDERLRSRADNEMWWRLRNVAKIEEKFYFLEHPVAYYRKHDASMIEYRKKNQRYNTEVTMLLEEQKNLRLCQGITRENTRFLKR